MSLSIDLRATRAIALTLIEDLLPLKPFLVLLRAVGLPPRIAVRIDALRAIADLFVTWSMLTTRPASFDHREPAGSHATPTR